MNTEEEWRPVVGYEGRYEVSDHGRVRSLKRISIDNLGRPRPVRELILRTRRRNGHLAVRLYIDSASKDAPVHILVARAFIGPRPTDWHVCHNDGHAFNNALTNLRYDTAQNNCLDQTKHGQNHWAARTHCSEGHPFSAENTGYRNGKRRCLTCHRRREADRRNRKYLAAAQSHEEVA